MAKLTKIGLIFCLLFVAGFRGFSPATGLRWLSAEYPHISTEVPPSKATTVVTSLNVAAEERDQLDILPDLLAHTPEPFRFAGPFAVHSGSASRSIAVGKRAGPPVPFYLLFCSLRIPLP